MAQQGNPIGLQVFYIKYYLLFIIHNIIFFLSIEPFVYFCSSTSVNYSIVYTSMPPFKYYIKGRLYDCKASETVSVSLLVFGIILAVFAFVSLILSKHDKIVPLEGLRSHIRTAITRVSEWISV